MIHSILHEFIVIFIRFPTQQGESLFRIHRSDLFSQPRVEGFELRVRRDKTFWYFPEVNRQTIPAGFLPITAPISTASFCKQITISTLRAKGSAACRQRQSFFVRSWAAKTVPGSTALFFILQPFPFPVFFEQFETLYNPGQLGSVDFGFIQYF